MLADGLTEEKLDDLDRELNAGSVLIDGVPTWWEGEDAAFAESMAFAQQYLRSPNRGGGS